MFVSEAMSPARLFRYLLQASKTTFGPVAYAILQLIALRVISRSGDVEDLGLFLLAQAVATPVAFLSGLRLRDQLATRSDSGRLNDRSRRLLATSGVAFFLVAPFWAVLAASSEAAVGILVLCSNLAQTFVWASQGTLLREKRVLATNVLDVLMGATSALAAFVGYEFLGGLPGVSAVLAASWGVLAVGAVRRTSQREKTGHGSQPSIKHDLLLGLGAMGGVGQISSARIGTAAILGSDALARIGTASFLVRASLPIFNGAIRILFPALATAHSTSPEQVANLENRIRRFLGLGLPLGVASATSIGFFAGPEIAGFLFADSVAPTRATAAVVLGSAPALYASMVYSHMLVARQQARSTTVMALSSMATTLVVIWPLAAAFGTPGAAAALGLGYLARLLVAEVELRRATVSAAHT